MWYVTLPSIIPTIVLMTTLNIGKLLKGGFDQVFNLYSPLVYETGDIIDTYVYRALISSGGIGRSAAAGFFQSVVGFALVMGANALVRRISRDNAMF